MGLMLSLVFSALVGFVSHVFWKPSRVFGDKHGRRWGEKIRHATGIITIAIPIAFVREVVDMDSEKTRTVASVLLTGLAYGGGNMLAHFADDIR